jgi:hypothetical protein
MTPTPGTDIIPQSRHMGGLFVDVIRRSIAPAFVDREPIGGACFLQEVDGASDQYFDYTGHTAAIILIASRLP